MVIPKNSSNSAPLQATMSSVIATAPAHVHAIRPASASGRSAVMLAKTPTLPTGFIMEKRAAIKLANAASAIMWLCFSYQKMLALSGSIRAAIIVYS
jgi:hypothetical protein